MSIRGRRAIAGVPFLLAAAAMCVAGPASAGGGSRPAVTVPPFAPDSGSLAVRCGALVDGVSEEVRNDVVRRITERMAGAQA